MNLELQPQPRNKVWQKIDDEHGDERKFIKRVANEINHPFYFYDLVKLREHIKFLFDQSKGIASLWYATKSNPISDVLKIMNEIGVKFDIASPGELAQVLRQDIPGEKVLCTGPAKSKKLLEKYLLNGLETFVLESHNQVKWLNEVAQKHNKVPKALLRLQLSWSSDDSSVLGGNEITPFGLEASEWEKLNLDDYPHIDFIGMHTFQWGNILEEGRLQEIWAVAAKRCSDLASKLNMPLKVLDLGGGIGIPYSDNEKSMDWVKLMEILKEIKENHQVEDIWLELGRYAVGPYGGYVTKVIDKKENRGKNMLVLDSGMNQLARPTLTKQSFPIEPLITDQDNIGAFQIHGPLCTALDSLGTYELPESLKIGDWLLFRQCGAYGFTESMPYFLCHSLPGEAVLTENQLEMVRMPRPANHYLV